MGSAYEDGAYRKHVHTFFYRQLDFPFEPGFANEILENEAKSCF